MVIHTANCTLHTAHCFRFLYRIKWADVDENDDDLHTSVHIQLPKSAGLHCIKPTEQTWKKSCEQLVTSHKAQSISTHTARYLKLVLRLPETMSPWLKWSDNHQGSQRLKILELSDKCKTGGLLSFYPGITLTSVVFSRWRESSDCKSELDCNNELTLPHCVFSDCLPVIVIVSWSVIMSWLRAVEQDRLALLIEASIWGSTDTINPPAPAHLCSALKLKY